MTYLAPRAGCVLLIQRGGNSEEKMGFLVNCEGKGGAEGAGRSSGGWWERSSVSYWSRDVVLVRMLGEYGWGQMLGDLRLHDISRAILNARYGLIMEGVIEGTTVYGSPRRRPGCARYSVWARRNRTSPPRVMCDVTPNARERGKWP